MYMDFSQYSSYQKTRPNLPIGVPELSANFYREVKHSEPEGHHLQQHVSGGIAQLGEQ
jgi:hypothetical protein